MSAAWATILALAVVTFVIKGAGPVLLGGKEFPPRVMAIVALLASALLGALVVVQTLGDGKALVLDARAGGVAAAAVALALRASLLGAVAVAAVVAAALRALT